MSKMNSLISSAAAGTQSKTEKKIRTKEGERGRDTKDKQEKQKD